MTYVGSLLDELGAAPNMPAARCATDHGWQLFDRTIEGNCRGVGGSENLAAARAQALRVCANCPELQRCRAWFDRLPPSQRPQGVCAGRLNVTTKRRTTNKETA